MMQGAAGVGGVGCGRLGATVVLHGSLHTEDHSPPRFAGRPQCLGQSWPRSNRWPLVRYRRLVGDELGGDRQYRVAECCGGGLPGGPPPVSRPATRGRRTSARPADSGASTCPQAPGAAHNPRLRGRDRWTSPHRKDAYRASCATPEPAECDDGAAGSSSNAGAAGLWFSPCRAGIIRSWLKSSPALFTSSRATAFSVEPPLRTRYPTVLQRPWHAVRHRQLLARDDDGSPAWVERAGSPPPVNAWSDPRRRPGRSSGRSYLSSLKNDGAQP